ncbi:MAG: hypothetical protein KF757_05580 [Phycisphaeraceae bacterium]|nr:hypothetical protein [Phycisphaeraceae bacterium]MCW5763643.1 hypothetical protein [Phycisphaeraceae bacterium]
MSSERIVTWSPQRCFWSVVEWPVRCKDGPAAAGLLHEAAADIPSDADTLSMVAARDGRGQTIVCAVSASDIQHVWSDPSGRDVISLQPATLPEWLDSDLDPSRLNFLVGRFAPRSLTRQRTVRHTVYAATLLLCAAMMALGLERRAQSHHASANRGQTAIEQMLQAANVDAEALERELAQRQDRLQLASALSLPADATIALALVLSAWPDATDAFVESINVAEADIQIAVSTSADPATLLEAISAPAGWRLEEPRLSSARGLSRIALRLRPDATRSRRAEAGP